MSQQGIDAECACSDCLVKSPNEVIIGTGTVLCKEGYEAGIHYWDFLAKQCGWHSFCGVSARDPGDEHETRHGHALGNLEGGYAIAGWYNGEGMFPGIHAGAHIGSYPLFLENERVGLCLDCDNGDLWYLRNGVVQGKVFEGILHRNVKLFPAFAGTGMTTEFTDIRFDQPIPESLKEILQKVK